MKLRIYKTEECKEIINFF